MINVIFYLVQSSFPSACNISLSETSPCSNGFGTSPLCNCFGGVDVAFAKTADRDLLALLIIQGDFVREFCGLKRLTGRLNRHFNIWKQNHFSLFKMQFL